MDEEKKREQQRVYDVGGAVAAGESVGVSVSRMAKKYERPPGGYTGNRKLFDDGKAKRIAKEMKFSSGKTVKDPYTGEKLFLRKKDAIKNYGKDWQKHLAEADHVVPLHKIFEECEKNPFLTSEDIKEIANSQENLKVISRKLNNAKRDKTNGEFHGDKKYQKDKGINLPKKSRDKAIRDGKIAQDSIDWKFKVRTAKNVCHEFHKSGTAAAGEAAKVAGGVAAVYNIVDVINGKKSPKEAIKNVVKVTGTSYATTYVTSGSVSVASRYLSVSEKPMLRMFGKSGVPEKIVSTFLATQGIVRDYIAGNITAVECIAQLGETGIATYTAGAVSAYVGTVLIPIPVVGTAIGAMIGNALAGSLFTAWSRTLKSAKLAREERIRIERECEECIRHINEYSRQLDEITEQYFKEHRKVFQEALGDMVSSLKIGDANGYISGTNKITRQLGGQVYFQNMNEFDDLMKSNAIIRL